MHAFGVTRRLLVPFQRVAVSQRNKGLPRLNKGLLTDAERGDSFTEPSVYRNETNITAQVKSRRKAKNLLREERTRNKLGELNIDSRTERELRSGKRFPVRPSEQEAVRAMDGELADGDQTVEEDYTASMRHLMQREASRRDHMMDKFAQTPTSREFHKLFKQLRTADDNEEAIEQHQQRLIDENGIYPTSRMDAYMLDDNGYFPPWVDALPYTIRDRVKFGSLGLTEEDEALRVRLGRMPRDKRLREWERVKAAKAYRTAQEETLTLSELRDARQGKRRFHWLQRKRQKRAAALRRMALRRPEGAEVWPSTAVDYSQRIAFIAQHVENGVQTKGEWPLDEGELMRAKVRRRQQEAERTFLMSADEKKMERSSGKMNGGIKELLTSIDEKPKPFKRLSRKVYANRVNAVVHGDQDEYGRRYRTMHQRSTRRMRRYDSMAEMALEREVRKEPRINTSGLNHTDDEDWSKHQRSWVDGMPSTRYGT